MNGPSEHLSWQDIPGFPERFWQKVSKGHPDECWEWKAARYQTGYGALSYKNITRYAHRVVWELHFGPITGRLHVLHRCDNPPCVNPAHLFVGTHLDNVADMVKKGRHSFGLLCGASNGNSKLKPEDVAEIRYSPLTQAALARRFGISQSNISDIVRNRIWRAAS